MNLSVAIDARPLVGNRTGIGVHTAEIARRMSLDPPPLLCSHASIVQREGLEHCRFRVDRAPLGVLWQQMRLASVVERAGADVLWGPHGTLPALLRIPGVVTIHDLTSMRMPGFHRIRTLVSFNAFIGRSLSLATAIAAVSQTTAAEVMREFNVPAHRITIVPNGVDAFFSIDDRTDGELPAGLEPGSYLLYAGTLEPRKGIGDLLAAWDALGESRPRLVLAGDPGWSTGARIRAAVSKHRDELMVTGFVPRTTLRSLYRNALVFVYPSHYEGFGLPPLEAMACGAPVITTDGGAIPEIVGDAALLTVAGDAGSLRDGMVRLLRDAALREELRERGRARARRFDWQTSADRMLELLRRAAG